MVEIVFKGGEIVNYESKEYTEYRYDGKFFIVIYEKQWIGFYNLDCIKCIRVFEKQEKENYYIFYEEK